LTPETFRSVPGKLVADWIASKKVEIDEYNAAIPFYDTLRAEYDVYATEWNDAWYVINDTDAT